MAVTILSKPYIAQSYNIVAVYNGIPFVLDSTLKTLGNFKYICEIFLNNVKITELRHNADIVNNKKGVFDIGRVIENYLASNKNIFQNYASYDGDKTVKRFHAQFGEEYSRVFSLVDSVSDVGQLRIDGNWNPPNNFDVVFISGASIAGYNGWKRLATQFSLNSARLVQPWLGKLNTDSVVIPGSRIYQFKSIVINGKTYLQCLLYKSPLGMSGFPYKRGDRVLIAPATGMNIFYNNTEWSIITDPTPDTLGGSPNYVSFVIDAPYKYPVASTVFSYVISRDNIVHKNQISTFDDKSMAWNGTRQWDQTWLKFNGTKPQVNSTWEQPFHWLQSAPDNFFKTFSDKPTKTELLRWNDTYQIQSFGGLLNTSGTGVDKTETHYRLETWSSDTNTDTGTIAGQAGVAFSGSCVVFQKNSNITSRYGVGDYINVAKGAFPPFAASGRIVSVVYTAPTTYIFTDIPYTTGGSGTITSTIRVRYYDILLQSLSQVIPCGPFNLLGYSEINGKVCYKYFLYPIKPTTGIYYTPSGGVTPGTIDNNGVNSPGTRPRVGEKWEFTIDTSCYGTPEYKLMWLNKMGGYDFYKFKLRTDSTFSIEKSQFDRKLDRIQSSNYYGHKSDERGRSTYNVASRETLSVNSDWLTQEELDWLFNIYESPDVYIVVDRNPKTGVAITEPYVIPVSVVAEEVVRPNKKWRGEKGSLYQYKLDLEMATERVIQRGTGDVLNITFKSLYE